VPGTPATRLFAVVAGDTGALKSGSGVTASVRTGEGQYTVTFGRSVEGCALLATPGVSNPLQGDDIYQAGSRATLLAVGTDQVAVATRNNDGSAYADRSFSIAAFCP
jgi:hypothetical protein